MWRPVVLIGVLRGSFVVGANRFERAREVRARRTTVVAQRNQKGA
jgi:hypothetical protein